LNVIETKSIHQTLNFLAVAIQYDQTDSYCDFTKKTPPRTNNVYPGIKTTTGTLTERLATDWKEYKASYIEDLSHGHIKVGQVTTMSAIIPCRVSGSYDVTKSPSETNGPPPSEGLYTIGYQALRIPDIKSKLDDLRSKMGAGEKKS
jgi:hypothetical protein